MMNQSLKSSFKILLQSACHRLRSARRIPRGNNVSQCPSLSLSTGHRFVWSGTKMQADVTPFRSNSMISHIRHSQRKRRRRRGDDQEVRWQSGSANGDDDELKSYRGPGGLSGEQLFDAVRKSVEMDAKFDKAAKEAAANGGYRDPPEESTTKSKASTASSKQNRESFPKSQRDPLQDVPLPTDMEISLWKVRELRALLHSKGIPYEDCLEKHDLIRRIQENGLDKSI